MAFKFEQLEVWQLAMEYVDQVEECTPYLVENETGDL